MWLRALYLLAIVFAVLAFAPAFAHLLEAPGKLELGREAYFTVQRIYEGWSLLGFVVIPSILLSAALVVALRRRRMSLAGAVVALTLQIWAQIVFWLFTWPANRATENWTVAPENWAALRHQWEYSHMVGAALNLAAVIALLLSLLAYAGRQQDASAVLRGQVRPSDLRI